MVTRARHQAQWLSRSIEDAGGRAIRLPVLEIRAIRDSEWLDTLIGRLAEFHIAIFISANAVRHALPSIHSRGMSLKNLRLAAVGLKTASTLEEAGYRVDICPRQGFTSEDLLELDAMRSVRGRNVVIFRGEGGRELLAEALTARGAQVEYVEVYRRVAPEIDPWALKKYISDSPVDLITIASAEGLKNLIDMGGPKLATKLRRITLLVGGQRMLQTAQEMGFMTINAVRDPSDEAMFEGIVRWARKRRRLRD